MPPINKLKQSRKKCPFVMLSAFVVWFVLMKMSIVHLGPEHPAIRDILNLTSESQRQQSPDYFPLVETQQARAETTHPRNKQSNPSQEYSSTIKPRVWRSWPSHAPLPCFEPDAEMFTEAVQTTQSRIGFLYVRPLKTGSSSMNGAVIRAAQLIANRENRSFDICKLRVFHGFASRYGYVQREKEQSFLYSSLRDPSQRSVSRFFFAQVSRRKVQPTDQNFINFLKATSRSSYLTTLSMMPYQDIPEHYQRDVGKVLEDYDFIAITERMDESLIVMQMLLGLQPMDMLYFSVKTNGGYDDGGADTGCTFIQKSKLTDGMTEYLGSDDWKARTRSDYMLYEAAKISLDLTIEHLGRDKFNKNLREFRKALAVVKSACEGLVKFPCALDGTRNNDTDCIWEDSGCGQKCLNEVSKEFKNGTTTNQR